MPGAFSASISAAAWREDSEALVLVRAVATALVAAVIGNLVIFPAEPLAATPLALRIGAVALGFAAYLALGRRVIVAIIVMELVFGLGAWLGQTFDPARCGRPQARLLGAVRCWNSR